MMTKSLKILVCLAISCSAAAAACGSAEPGDLDDRSVAQDDNAIGLTESNLKGGAATELSDVAPGEDTGEEPDGATCVGWDNGARHCLAHCGAGWEYVGAYPNIQHGECTNSGVKYCNNSGRGFYDACWGWGS